MPGRYIGQFRPEFSRVYQDRDLAWIVPFEIPLAVGLVGDRLAGKSTVASYLAERHGFRLVALGAVLREYAGEQGVGLTSRLQLQRFGDEVRATHRDGGHLARVALRRVRQIEGLPRGPGYRHGKVVFTGIKHRGELEVLASLQNFAVVRVEAPLDRRLERALRSGLLQAAYENLRANGGSVEDLSVDEQQELFETQIDALERDGDPSGRWPPEYRASLKEIETCTAVQEATTLDGNCDDLITLRERADAVLEGLTPE